MSILLCLLVFRILFGNDYKWVKFKYEKLRDFCYDCGIIDHVDRDCDTRLGVPKNASNQRKRFGPGMRADPGRHRRAT